MSIKTNITELPEETQEKISTDLTIKIENSKYGFGAQSTYIYPYELEENDDLYLPFSYAVEELNFIRPSREDINKSNVRFEGNLRPEQIFIKKEAIDTLSRKGSVLISLYTGGGKCLGLDTPVLMFDGSIKMVQDIEQGEQIMGDDSTPRNILSTCRGEEQMYKVILENGESFTANETHILSLCIIEKCVMYFKPSLGKFIVKYFDKYILNYLTVKFNHKENARDFMRVLEQKDDDFIDISIKDYIVLPSVVKNNLKAYKTSINFSSRKTDIEPYIVGL